MYCPELRSLGEGFLGTRIPAVPGGWMPGTEHCMHRILLISTSMISPLQGSGLPVPEHLLPLSRHPPLCYLSNIQSFFRGKFAISCSYLYTTPLSTAKYQLAVGNVKVMWLQPMDSLSSDPSLAPQIIFNNQSALNPSLKWARSL